MHSFRKTLLFALFSMMITGSRTVLVQTQPAKPESTTLKLKYASEHFHESGFKLHTILPVAISGNRLLVALGDMLYMLDDRNQIVWEYSVEPNVIYDVAADARGMICIAISDGLFRVLDISGQEVWGNFMNGSANYTQVKSFDDGFLIVVDMEGYREKRCDCEDSLEFWKDQKMVWRKSFPRESKLLVWENRILAVKQVKDGQEITEIR